MSNKLRKNRQKMPSGSSPVVRRAFSMQETDAQIIEALRVRCATQGMLVNQSEIVRVGLHVLADLNDRDLKERLTKLERLAAVRSRTSK